MQKQASSAYQFSVIAIVLALLTLCGILSLASPINSSISALGASTKDPCLENTPTTTKRLAPTFVPAGQTVRTAVPSPTRTSVLTPTPCSPTSSGGPFIQEQTLAPTFIPTCYRTNVDRVLFSARTSSSTVRDIYILEPASVCAPLKLTTVVGADNFFPVGSPNGKQVVICPPKNSANWSENIDVE